MRVKECERGDVRGCISGCVLGYVCVRWCMSVGVSVC